MFCEKDKDCKNLVSLSLLVIFLLIKDRGDAEGLDVQGRWKEANMQRNNRKNERKKNPAYS